MIPASVLVVHEHSKRDGYFPGRLCKSFQLKSGVSLHGPKWLAAAMVPSRQGST